jgi:hypothetical protein
MQVQMTRHDNFANKARKKKECTEKIRDNNHCTDKIRKETMQLRLEIRNSVQTRSE